MNELGDIVRAKKKEEETLKKMDTKEPAMIVDLLSYTHPESNELVQVREEISKLIAKGNKIKDKYKNDPVWAFFKEN